MINSHHFLGPVELFLSHGEQSIGAIHVHVTLTLSVYTCTCKLHLTALELRVDIFLQRCKTKYGMESLRFEAK